MKSLLSPRIRIKNINILLVSFVAVFSFLLASASASALTLDSVRDCDSNAVIRCGALTTSELQRKYNNQTGVATIFHDFGITHIDINEIDSTTVAGKVTAGGRVLVNGQVVANNAMTAGRQNMPGSQAVTANGITFFERPPSVSFRQNSLSVFVVMKDGRFDFAIIASCGNPVKATPVVKKNVIQKQQTTVVTPPPATTKPAKIPATTQTQSQTQTVVVTKNVPVVAPAATPTPAPTPQPVPKQIPNTGVGDVVGLGSFVSLVAAGAHTLYRRKFF